MPHDNAYRAAKKKIQQALKSGATELDLGDMQLTELPESIGQLKHFFNLVLTENHWKLVFLWRTNQHQGWPVSFQPVGIEEFQAAHGQCAGATPVFSHVFESESKIRLWR